MSVLPALFYPVFSLLVISALTLSLSLGRVPFGIRPCVWGWWDVGGVGGILGVVLEVRQARAG